VTIATTGSELTLAELYGIAFQGVGLMPSAPVGPSGPLGLGGYQIAFFTSHDADILYDGDTYQAIPIRRDNISNNARMEVDKITISVGLVGVKIGTAIYTIPEIIHRGWLRNAEITITLVDYANPTEPGIVRGVWYVSDDISYNAGILTLKCGSLLDRLSDKIPAHIYSEYCLHSQYGAYCGLYTFDYEEGDYNAGASTTVITASIFAYSNHAAHYWDQARIRCADGANSYNGADIRTVKSHSDGYVTVSRPFSSPVEDGCNIYALPHCQKNGDICNTTFGNYANFLGFPHIPNPKMLYG
jgi:uncharacterized phage protein (TIGR02218 family)